MSKNQNYVGKPIGARRLTWFPLIEDPETGVAKYTAPVRLSRLIQIACTPTVATGQLESDDGVEDEMSIVMGYEVSIDASQVTDSIRAGIFGHELDANGGITFTNTDASSEGAIAWEERLSAKGGGVPRYKKVILYKGKFAEFAETANTSVQGGVEYQTHKVTGKFYARNDGKIRYSVREDTEGVSADLIAAWFDTPQESDGVFSSTVGIPKAQPVAGNIVAGEVVKLTSGTGGASIRYTTDGSDPTIGGRDYDGPIEIRRSITLKAIAVKGGNNKSEMLEAEYEVS